jgi:hypothetical protein
MGSFRWRRTKAAHDGSNGNDGEASKKWFQPAGDEHDCVTADAIIVEVTVELSVRETDGKRDVDAKEIACDPNKANDNDEPNDTAANPTLAEKKEGCWKYKR